MIAKTLRLLSAVWLLILLSYQAYAGDCQLISSKDQLHGTGGVGIFNSGSYCLKGDIVYKPRFDMHMWQYKKDKSIIRVIRAKNVSINLQGHTVEANAKYTVNLYLSSSIKNGVVKNGNIGIKGFASGMPSFRRNTRNNSSGMCTVIYPECEDVSYLESIDKQPPTYTANNVKIDNIKVFAEYRGIELGGGGNIIRNSTIEVDGHTAIFNYGPNPIIENNTIIIHGKGSTTLRTSEDAVALMKGAIKLRDAKGGIIRNNKIIYKGGWFSWGKAPAAINLLDSKDVVIEGNTIQGFEKLVRENGDTSFTEKGNVMK